MRLRLVLPLLLISLAMAGRLDAAVPSGLKLAGTGEVYYLGIFKVYEASLYASPDRSPDDILAADSSRCLQLDYAVELSPENFIEAADTILSRQHDQKAIDSVRRELDLLNASYREVKENDRYQLCYDAETRSTSLLLNGTRLVHIPSARFAEIYFGIWLGKTSPLDEDLRVDLLSGLQRGRN